VADAKAGATTPRAAIIDLRLPDGSGFEVAAHLTGRDPHLPVLFVTAYRTELLQQAAEKLVDASTMEKPVDMEQLLEWVGRAIGKDGSPQRSGR
jgi:DNA-binding NtrC family response regulator